MQDFSYKNLRGYKFKGQDLSEADFTCADICGADFTNTKLCRANFTGVKAGLQKRWVTVQFVISLVFSIAIPLNSVLLNASFAALIFEPSNVRKFGYTPGLILVASVIIVYIAIAYQGYTYRLFSLIIILAAFVVVISAVFSIQFMDGTILAFIGSSVVTSLTVSSCVFIGSRIFLVLSLVGIIYSFAFANPFSGSGSILSSATVAIAAFLLNVYVSWRTRVGDEKFGSVRTFRVAFSSIGGTSFCGANLTNANFTGATLSSTNFMDSWEKTTILKQASWKDVQKLDYARLGKSILANSKVRKLLVTSEGINQDYMGANLRGANLTDATLNGATLQHADLGEAILRGADLRNVNLTEVQAIGTDFTGAFMSGACIHAWNIDSTTKLQNVNAQFVYLLEHEQERRPSNGEFAPGEFTALFQEALNTVDLIFADGLDWKAFFQSFQKLRSQFDDDNLSIQAIEKKSGGAFVIRLEVSQEADKAVIESRAKELYERDLQILEAQYQALLQGKDGQIAIYQEWLKAERRDNTDLTGIVEKMADKETSKITQNFNAQIFGGVAGNVEGNQIIYSPEQQQTLSEAAAEIQKLLDQLSQTYSIDTKAGQMKLASEAIAQIEGNPALVQRVLSAGKAGGIAALEQLLNHPAASFVIAAMEDWQQTKGS
jgi:uncharacterized protein YjbI with pentapeptide repeats